MKTLVWHTVPGNSTDHMVLCHGFGASGMDLIDLSSWLDPDQHWNWHFPQGPFSLFGAGWAWFPKNSQEQELALQGRLFNAIEGYDSNSIDESLDSLIQEITTRIPRESNLVVGGFSQGSMMALLASLRPEIYPQVSGTILLSSALFATQRLTKQYKPLQRVFQSHGKSDTILSYQGALNLQARMAGQAKSWEFNSFEEGHTIPPSLQKPLIRFINSCRGV